MKVYKSKEIIDTERFEDLKRIEGVNLNDISIYLFVQDKKAGKCYGLIKTNDKENTFPVEFEFADLECIEDNEEIKLYVNDDWLKATFNLALDESEDDFYKLGFDKITVECIDDSATLDFLSFVDNFIKSDTYTENTMIRVDDVIEGLLQLNDEYLQVCHEINASDLTEKTKNIVVTHFESQIRENSKQAEKLIEEKKKLL